VYLLLHVLLIGKLAMKLWRHEWHFEHLSILRK
jgi:hypothetical protein